MARFFAPPSAWNADRVLLDLAETRHACEVLRLKVGDRLTVFDGAGQAAEGTLSAANRHGGEVTVESARQSSRAACAITLIQAVPKGKLMEWILEKATELGVSRIVPVLTNRTVVQIDGPDGERKQEKWQRAVIEACKQCGQNWLPQVDAPLPLTSFLNSNELGGFGMFASLYPGARPFRDVLSAASDVNAASVFVGPEGDFTPKEVEAMLAWGAVPVTLGPIVLRVETAALYSLSILAHTFQPQHSRDE
jgi:16S rRNA (uracil1498-N3)-methyltransferase